MSADVHARFYLENFECTEKDINELYNFLSENGWQYSSEDFVGRHWIEDEWREESFSEAIENITGKGEGALSIYYGKFGGHIYISESELSFYFDGIHFKSSKDNSESNSEKLIELFEEICKNYRIKYMYGYNDFIPHNSNKPPEVIDEINWMNFFSKKILDRSPNYPFPISNLEIIRNINEGIFLVISKNPLTYSEKKRETNEQLGLNSD